MRKIILYIIIICIILLTIIHVNPLFKYAKIPRLSYSRIGTTKPWILYRTSKSRIVNEKMYRNCYQKWLNINSNICIEWFNNNDCLRFMRTQRKEILQAYLNLKPGAFKADLWRLCILYERGGIYVDAHTIPYVSINKIVGDINILQRENMFISSLDPIRSGGGIHNGFIIVSAKHPFIKAGISRIIRNVQNKSYEDHNLAITGPICLSRAINSFLGRPEKSKFVNGWNRYGTYSLYLYKFEWGPFQYIYNVKGMRILSKKHCTLSYCLDKLKFDNYANLIKNKDVFN